MQELNSLTSIEFVSHLHSLVKIWAKDGWLRCSVPRDAATQGLCVEMIRRKAKLVDFAQSNRSAACLTAPPIQPAPRDGNLPLSFAQQRMRFTVQSDPGNPTYDILGAVHLNGPLDVASLTRSIHEIVRRHEVLHTAYRAPWSIRTSSTKSSREESIPQ
jgi:hypothetical protein